MSFSKALFYHIKTNGGLSYDIAFGNANGLEAPYYVMLALPGDGEQPYTMNLVQGESGSLQLQFSVAGITGAGATMDILKPLQTYVRTLYGNVSYGGETYSIWRNDTGGISPIAGGSINTWDSIFESTLWWERTV